MSDLVYYFIGFNSLNPSNNALRLSTIIPSLQMRKLKYSKIAELSNCMQLQLTRAGHSSPRQGKISHGQQWHSLSQKQLLSLLSGSRSQELPGIYPFPWQFHLW